MPSRPPSPLRKAARSLSLAASLLLAGLFPVGLFPVLLLRAETCITQSQMKPAERDTLAAAALKLATIVQSNDAAALRQQTLPEYAKDFSGMSSLVGSTASKIKGAALQVDQVYDLDASTLKALGGGTNQDAQFFCSLNQSMAEANFLIPALPPGRYAFAMVTAGNIKAPWHLSFLLKQDAVVAGKPGGWSMAGVYPKPLTAAGHDGIWYWTSAREMVKAHHPWTAYFDYKQAQALLQPAAFVTSTHFDNLLKESTSAAPPALSQGINADTPLVVKGANGAEYRFTDLTTDDSFGADQVDIVAHLAPDPAPDQPPDSPHNPAAPNPDAAANGSKPNSASKSDAKSPAAQVLSPRDRNSAAMSALLAAYPELRGNFHGVWIFADAPGKSPFVTEEPMANIQ